MCKAFYKDVCLVLINIKKPTKQKLMIKKNKDWVSTCRLVHYASNM